MSDIPAFYSPEILETLKSNVPSFFNRPYNQEAADKTRRSLRVEQVTRWVVLGEDGEVESLPYECPVYAKGREEAEEELEGIVEYEARRQPVQPLPNPNPHEPIHFFMSSGTGTITEAPAIVITDNE